MIDPKGANGCGVAAARAAGYRGDARQLAAQASANLRNPNVQSVIAGMIEHIMEHAMTRVREALDATTTKTVLNKDGAFVYSDAQPDHRTRLAAAELLLGLWTKVTMVAPGAGEHHDDGDEGPTRGEAIDAAKECLAALAPHLLSDEAVSRVNQGETAEVSKSAADPEDAE